MRQRPWDEDFLNIGVAVRPCAGITQIRFNRSVAIEQATLSAWLSQAPLANKIYAT